MLPRSVHGALLLSPQSHTVLPPPQHSALTASAPSCPATAPTARLQGKVVTQRWGLWTRACSQARQGTVRRALLPTAQPWWCGCTRETWLMQEHPLGTDGTRPEPVPRAGPGVTRVTCRRKGRCEGAPALDCSMPGTWARQGLGDERVRAVPMPCHKAFADLSINICQQGRVPGSAGRGRAVLSAVPGAGAALTNGS